MSCETEFDPILASDPDKHSFSEPLGGQHLMVRIAAKMDIPDKQVRYRSFDKVKIHFYATDESVYTHNVTSKIQSIDQRGVQFNNIVNGHAS